MISINVNCNKLLLNAKIKFKKTTLQKYIFFPIIKKIIKKNFTNKKNRVNLHFKTK